MPEGEHMTNVAEVPVEVYLEIGAKRVVAGALEWPGWCRAGRDAGAALDALLAAGPRYAQVLTAAGIHFVAPAGPRELAVAERFPGGSTTDFGAPELAPAADARPFGEADLERCQTLLRAGWAAFDAALQAAGGVELRKGPRGGGRDLEKIAGHVLASEQGYLAGLAWRFERRANEPADQQRDRTRQAVLDALAAAARDALPARRPRGGALWLPRYFVRRVAWHTLDHVWEIEDRRLS